TNATVGNVIFNSNASSVANSIAATSTSAQGYSWLRLVGTGATVGDVTMNGTYSVGTNGATYQTTTSRFEVLGSTAQIGNLNATTANATNINKLVILGGVGVNGTAGDGVATTLTLNTTTNSSFAGVITDGTVTAANATLSGITSNFVNQATAATDSLAVGHLIKSGAATQTLSGVNTYTGNTTISQGTLSIASTGTINSTAAVSIGAGEFNYNSATALSQGVSFSGTGGKLSGNGTITPSVTITAGNTLAPGNSIGNLTFGTNLTLAANSTYSVELGTVNANASLSLSDRVVVTGTLGLGGNLTLVDNAGANGNGNMSAGAYRIATSTGATTGNFSSVINPLNATLHEKVVYGTNTTDLNLYRLATGNTGNVTLGKARVGDTSFNTANNLTVTNTAAADGFSEKLNATASSQTGDASAPTGGPINILAAGSSSTSIGVGLDTTSSGAKSGTVNVSYLSDGTGTSDYATTATNGPQTVTLTGNVYELAQANLSQVGGSGELTGGPSTYNLNFGTGLALSTTYTLSFNLLNGAVNLFQDGLTGDYTLVGGSPFGTTAVDFTNLLAGSSDTFDITFNTAVAGFFTDTFTFSGTSIQSGLSDAGALGNFIINLSAGATAVPEPNASMLIGGLGMLALLRRRRA
ncbi:MAG: autotransporter-associated beta strand repeat-containing protein, partial [Gloeobacteraceae cyanobacterium ES-bin-144]|nr:autotransporter-associated beta strand repeat-containing protein [Verrucomicrobiales bacterium]